MSNITITSIICISFIIIIGIICYTSYKIREDSNANKFFKTVHENFVQYENIRKDINDVKTLINSMQTGIEFISMQISNKENNKNE